MSNLTLLPSNAVEVSGARTFTTSKMVAKVFGKLHGHVLRDIEIIKADCPEDFSQSNFGMANYLDDQGKPRPMAELTKDGFTLLAMGYTGAKAMRFKLAYIKRFNELEAQARGENPAISDGSRFLATFEGGRWIFKQMLAGEFCLPASDWPKAIQDSGFPSELLPDVLSAVSARMKSLPENSAGRRFGRSDLHSAVLSAIDNAGATGFALRDLSRNIWAFRNLAQESRNALIQQLVQDGHVVEVTTTNPKTKRKSKVLVAKRFVKGEN